MDATKLLLTNAFPTHFSYNSQIAEISRILRTGGIFVGTTFLRYTSSTPWILRPLREVTLLTYSKN